MTSLKLFLWSICTASPRLHYRPVHLQLNYRWKACQIVSTIKNWDRETKWPFCSNRILGSRITALEIGVPTCANPLELRWWSVRAQRLGVTESSRGFHECQGITHWSINSTLLRSYSTPPLFLPSRLQSNFQERCAITQVLSHLISMRAYA